MRTALKTGLLCLAILAPVDVAIAAGTAAPAPGAYRPRLLSVAEASADIALLRRGLETIHPGLYRYQPKAVIDAAFDRLTAAAARPITELELHGAIAAMVATIHCDHSKPEMSDALTQWRNDHATHLPMRFRLIEGRAIVVATTGQSGAPPVGAEILAINGVAMPDLLGRLAGFVAYDGDTDQAIAVKLGNDSDLQGDDFNEYHPALFGFQDRWQIEWKAIGATRANSATLAALTFSQWQRLDAPDGAYQNEFYKAVRWRLAGKTARLSIDTFVNYRNPVQATAFLGGFFRAMAAAGTEHLILDLRRNGGGSEDVSIALGRWLFDKPFLWSLPIRYKAIRFGTLPQHIESWGDRDALFNPPESAFTRTADGWFDRNPTSETGEADDDNSTIVHQVAPSARFTGRLTILTGPQNGSGATRTIAQLREKRGATLIGEETAGSAEGPTAGHVLLMTLPASGLKVRIPNAWNRTAITSFVPRRGVAADVTVVPTLADFEAGRDRALEMARAAPAPSLDCAAVLPAALAGAWTGSLDYRDYRNAGRVVLPARLVVAGAATGIDFAFTHDDGPGKILRSMVRWTLSADRLSIDDGKSRAADRVLECRRSSDGALTLVTEGEGRENDVPVLTRTILTIAGGHMRLTRQTRTPGKPFLMRNSHDLSRG